MSAPGKGRQADQLIDRIDAEAQEEIDRVLDAARAEAERKIRQAHRRARERMRAAIRDLRQTRAQELLRERARLDTARRKASQAAALRAIETGRPLLRAALTEIWAVPSGRRAWAEQVITAAAEVLEGRHWRVEHPEEWGASQMAAARKTIETRTGTAPAFTADPGIVAGLRISADAACLDGTLDSILSDEEKIDARLLAALGETAKETSS